jgi:DNA polymerase I-like protein with 3'-5' exonuclease and polymerase domains
MPWHPESKILSIAAAYPEENRIEYLLDPTAEQINDLLRGYDTFLGWNLPFDVSWLLAKGVDRDIIMGAKYQDGLIAWYFGDQLRKMYAKEELFARWGPELSYSLKQAVREFVPEYADYEGEIDYENLRANLDQLKEYNIMDVKLTVAIADTMYDKINKSTPRMGKILDQYCSAIPLIADATQRGLEVNRTVLAELDERCDQAITSMCVLLDVDPGEISSTIKFRNLMFKTWGWTPPVDQKLSKNEGRQIPLLTPKGYGELRKTGDYDYKQIAVSGLALLRLHDEGHEEAEILYDLKKMLTKRNKFADGTAKACDFNECDRVYPVPRIHGTYTGRVTYSSKTLRKPTGVALHQWQNDKQVRDVFRVPDGFVLAEFDASGQEMRLIADRSEDPEMIRLFRDDKDLHSSMGADIAGVDYDSFMMLKAQANPTTLHQRKLGKLANLSLQYRTSAWTLRDRAREAPFYMNLSIGECYKIIDTYHEKYIGISSYWDNAIALARSQGYAETCGGRRISLDFGDTRNDWRITSTAINFPIQGTGADMKMLALDILKPVLARSGALFAWDLHDGIFYYLPKGRAEPLARMIKETLDNIDYEKHWGWRPKVSLPWDASVGPSWGQLEEM